MGTNEEVTGHFLLMRAFLPYLSYLTGGAMGARLHTPAMHCNIHLLGHFWFQVYFDISMKHILKFTDKDTDTDADT